MSQGIFFCNNGQHVVTASSDKTVRVWNPLNGEEVAVLKGFPGWVNSIEVSRDQSWLVATSDHIISVWNFNEVLEKAKQRKLELRQSIELNNEIDLLKLKERERIEIQIEKERNEMNKKKKKKKKMNHSTRDNNHGQIKDSEFVVQRKKVQAKLQKLIKKTKKISKPSYELHGHCDLVYHATFNPNRHRIVSASHDMSLRMWQIIPTVPDTMVLPPSTNQLLVNSIQLSWKCPSTLFNVLFTFFMIL